MAGIDFTPDSSIDFTEDPQRSVPTSVSNPNASLNTAADAAIRSLSPGDQQNLSNSVSSSLPQPPGATSPGVFQPGSRTEAFGRGFANAASFGLGKWVNALLTTPLNMDNPSAESVGEAVGQSSDKTDTNAFWKNVTGSVEQQKTENTNAAVAHPGYYVAGAVAPAAITLGAGGASALPATAAGRTALGAGIGAGTGATESTNLKQLGTNVATGTVVGGALSAVPAGIGALANKYGTAGALKALNSAITDAQSEVEETSKAGLAKLHQLFAPLKPSGSSTNLNERDLMDAALRYRDAISGSIPGLSQATKSGATGAVVSSLAPSWGQIGGDAARAIGGGALGGGIGGGLTAGLGGVNPLYGIAAGAAYGAKSGAKDFALDFTRKAALGYANSPVTQNGVAVSPLALGAGAGQSVQPLGLSGALGQYIDQTWRR